MFFGLITPKRGAVTLPAKPMKESVHQTIRDIHMSFDIAADDALAEAQRIIAQGFDEAKQQNASILKKAGFTSAAIVVEQSEISTVRDRAQSRADIVMKYKVKYPQYKFIFIDQVEAICQKYGLVCGKVSLYKGDVPEKNIKEISEFKVSDEDIYSQRTHSYSSGKEFDPNATASMNSKAEIMREKQREKDEERELRNLMKGTSYAGSYHYSSYYHTDRLMPLFICAPKGDMNTQGMQLTGSFLTKDLPDPIVLHYVKDGFLIVSKWGLEGEDPSLTNENMN